jgi:hypothetical protein
MQSLKAFESEVSTAFSHPNAQDFKHPPLQCQQFLFIVFTNLFQSFGETLRELGEVYYSQSSKISRPKLATETQRHSILHLSFYIYHLSLIRTAGNLNDK